MKSIIFSDVLLVILQSDFSAFPIIKLNAKKVSTGVNNKSDTNGINGRALKRLFYSTLASFLGSNLHE